MPGWFRQTRPGTHCRPDLYGRIRFRDRRWRFSFEPRAYSLRNAFAGLADAAR